MSGYYVINSESVETPSQSRATRMFRRMPEQKQTIQFYSHHEDKRYGAFSNFYASPTEWNGLIGKTTEHLFQAAKFDHRTGDKDLDEALSSHFARIMNSSTPGESKKLGNYRDLPLRPDWESKKISIMREIVNAKVSQHPEIATLLMSTGDAYLEERTPYDDFWGTNWSGQGRNELGKILMSIRDNLRYNHEGQLVSPRGN